MSAYRAPVADMMFLLRDVFHASEQFAACPDFAEVNDELTEAILTEAGRFCEQKLAPLNRQGDEVGASFDNGVVTTPPGVREAYHAFAEGGWPGLSLDHEYGGQGLPKAVQVLVDEMITGANMSFQLYGGLTRGAVEAITSHASEDLKARWLPRMISGEWTGSMCLTEPHCGTDLGLLRCRAEPLGDGRYAVSGTKIFISAGEHDLTQNIVHLVLARLPDAAPGVKGISLFLVPKMLLDENEQPSERNHLSCGSIEHKMGIKGSPTCVMNFDGAIGWLVGQPGKGLPAMFTMMNAERLMVGVQGIGIAEAAWQRAAAYAKDRLQGRDPLTGKEKAPILVHPDVRRNVLTARAWAEGMRAFALWTALYLDRSLSHSDANERSLADGVVALVTPIIKAAGSDLGFEAAVAAQQVFGGHGYIREWGVEQLVRDARITQIYEGTNGVQAMDLVGRKLSHDGGALPQQFFALVDDFLAKTAGEGAFAHLHADLANVLSLTKNATSLLQQSMTQDPLAGGAVATDYLRLFALLGMGWMWALQVQAVQTRPVDDPLRQAKEALAVFFYARLLPQSHALAKTITTGSQPVMQMPFDAF